MDFTKCTLVAGFLIINFTGNLGSVVYKQLIDRIQLIAETNLQFLRLENVDKSLAKEIGKHCYIDHQAEPEKENVIVFNGDVNNIESFEEFQIPQRILITELNSENQEK